MTDPLQRQNHLVRFDPRQAFVLFENPLQLFFDSVEEIKILDSSKVSSGFERLEELSKKGFYLVGYVSYEAFHGAFGLDLSPKKAQTFEGDPATEVPLLYFHAFAQRLFLSPLEFEEQVLPKLIQAELASPLDLAQGSPSIKANQQRSFSPPAVYNFKATEDFESYCGKVNHILQQELKNGNTYQVNFTFKTKFQWQGRAFDIFRELRKYQSVERAGFYHFDFDICSYSPELFLNKKGPILTAKPMKGTARRGANAQEDAEIIEQMRNDPKIRSENIMIVDLLRNDLGRVAEPCSVEVPQLFDIETYATLFQMTSTVQAQVSSSLSFYEIMTALFPCGSITGAPKNRTMQIIDKLENERRNLYTGAIGYLEPSGDFQFNVAIRTLVLNQSKSGRWVGELGIGSGIVYESDASKEWEECHLKSQFVKLINSSFQFIETFAYDGEAQSYRYLDLHLQRLQQSACIFGFQCPVESIRKELDILKLHFDSQGGLYRVRLLLFQNGQFELKKAVLEPQPTFYRVVLCQIPIQSESILQHHKTTNRQFYDDFYRKAQSEGYDEILFFNEKNFCVEGSRHTLIIKKQNQFLTPSLEDGALPGVFRQVLISDPKFALLEKSLTLKDVQEADEVYLANSLRGIVRAEVIEKWLNFETSVNVGEE